MILCRQVQTHWFGCSRPTKLASRSRRLLALHSLHDACPRRPQPSLLAHSMPTVPENSVRPKTTYHSMNFEIFCPKAPGLQVCNSYLPWCRKCTNRTDFGLFGAPRKRSLCRPSLPGRLLEAECWGSRQPCGGGLMPLNLAVPWYGLFSLAWDGLVADGLAWDVG